MDEQGKLVRRLGKVGGGIILFTTIIGFAIYLSYLNSDKDKERLQRCNGELNKIEDYYNQMFELKFKKSFAETSEEENFLWNQYYNLNNKVDSIYKLLPTDYQKMVDSIKLKEFNWDN